MMIEKFKTLLAGDTDSKKLAILLANQHTDNPEVMANITYKKVAVQYSADKFLINQTLVLSITFILKNSHLRQALYWRLRNSF